MHVLLVPRSKWSLFEQKTAFKKLEMHVLSAVFYLLVVCFIKKKRREIVSGAPCDLKLTSGDCKVVLQTHKTAQGNILAQISHM